MNLNEEILFYAFRYALGRRSYAVSEVSDAIIENWDSLSNTYKDLIIEEINTAIKNKSAGMECDIKNWQRILLLEEAVQDGKEVKA